MLRNVSDAIEMPRQFVLGAGTSNITETFEFYRIASSVFLHIDGWHLLMNVFVLGVLGELFERVLSPVRFMNVFFLSGLVAYGFFVAFSPYDVGAGASGCIYGCWGAYFHLKLHYEKYLPGSVNAIAFRHLAWLLLIQLLLEIFVLDNVDVMTHVGGFSAGFGLLYCLPMGRKLEQVNQPCRVEKYLASVLLLGYAGGLFTFLNLYYA